MGREPAHDDGRALVALVEIAARALSAGDGASLWAATADAVARALDARACALWEGRDGEVLTLRAASAADGPRPGLPSAGARESAALRTGAPVVSGETVSVPVPGGDGSRGVLTVERAQGFGDPELLFVRAAAHVLATAIERAARADGDGEAAERGAIPLTPRERAVLALMAQGLANAAIAQRLGIGVTTVRSHVRGVIEKLRVNSKLQAVVRARERGLLL